MFLWLAKESWKNKVQRQRCFQITSVTNSTNIQGNENKQEPGLTDTTALFKKQLSGLMVKQNAIVGTNVLNSQLYCSTIMLTQWPSITVSASPLTSGELHRPLFYSLPFLRGPASFCATLTMSLSVPYSFLSLGGPQWLNSSNSV